jgi:hypothetical protein
MNTQEKIEQLEKRIEKLEKIVLVQAYKYADDRMRRRMGASERPY